MSDLAIDQAEIGETRTGAAIMAAIRRSFLRWIATAPVAVDR